VPGRRQLETLEARLAGVDRRGKSVDQRGGDEMSEVRAEGRRFDVDPADRAAGLRPAFDAVCRLGFENAFVIRGREAECRRLEGVPREANSLR
jgi:hypothetical protein